MAESKSIRICGIDKCEAESFCRGMCPKHYERNRKYGDPNIVLKPRRNGGPCEVTGCGRASRKVGLCNMHYGRLRKYGEVGPAGRIGDAYREDVHGSWVC